MNHWQLGLLLAGALCARAGEPEGGAAPDLAARAVVEVRAAETAFAASMAARDLSAFAGFVSAEALFFGRTLLRGRAAVVAGWEPFFQDPQPPFSWEPETVEALDSGGLALSSGPVRDPDGRVIATFQSIWRKEADGRWRVVFDKGGPVCPPEGE
ncbi:MAG: nuclear transport factor 2 family protein [Candidatus Delongbacteria bacterium]